MSAVTLNATRVDATQGLWRPALVLFAVMSLITGLAYPLLVTGVAQTVFPQAARGSLIVRNGEVVGSTLIGQAFSAPGYFWSRPSATSPAPYNAGSSGGSNLGPLNPALAEAVRVRIEALREADRGLASGPADRGLALGSADRGLASGSADRGLAPGSADPGHSAPVPIDLVTSSASGLDPHISRAAADYQAARVARARDLPLAQVQALIEQHTQGVWLGFLGEPRVGVLELNLALDALAKR